MTRTVTVVVINSLSYTGTTWLNLVLGCHERAFALGPPDRVWRMRREPDWPNACRVHAAVCPFWPAFGRGLDPKSNFFLQLAEQAGRDVIITNNPLPADCGGAASDLRHPQVIVRNIQLIRDGRALAASYVRKHPGSNFLDAVKDWLRPSYASFRFDPNDPDLLSLRYEDVLARPREHLHRIAAWLGMSYSDEALRFWEFEHHITAGNQGTIAMVKFAQDIAASDFKEREFYERQFAAVRENPERGFADERWREELSTRDRFVFDHYCGEASERFGYERDRFTLGEVERFGQELKLAIAAERKQLQALTGTGAP